MKELVPNFENFTYDVLILRGLPGSGKSTFAQKTKELSHRKTFVVSSDDYFMENGQYVFDREKLGEAHGSCLRRFMTLITSVEADVVIVDNTNLSDVEVAPYWALAAAYGKRAKILAQLNRKEEKLYFERNTHGVPRETFSTMAGWYASSVLLAPKWWNQSIIDSWFV